MSAEASLAHWHPLLLATAEIFKGSKEKIISGTCAESGEITARLSFAGMFKRLISFD